MPSNHLILCCLLLLLPPVFPSIRVFSSESALHIRWPKYWSFSISPSSEYSGFISFRINCLISLLSKGLFSAQPSLWANSYLYKATGKTIALTIQTFVGKVMSFLFNMLSQFVIAFLPRSKQGLAIEGYSNPNM